MSFIGIGVGIAAAPLIGSVGAGIAGGVVGGAATSAIVSAAQGKPITAKDVLIGAGTGAVTGGIGGAIGGGAGSAATSATEQGVKTAAEQGIKTAAEQGTKTAVEQGAKTAVDQGVKTAAEQGTKTVVEQGTKTAAEQGTKTAVEQGANQGVAGLAGAPAKSSYGAISPNFTGLSGTAPPPTSDILGTGISTGSAGFDKALEKGAVEGVMSGGKEGLGAYQTAQYNAGVKKADQEAQAAGAANAGLGQNMANDLYSNQMKTSMLAKGGSVVHMDSGSFVIPADIVSALGDGSSDAGFRFLESFFKDAEAE